MQRSYWISGNVKIRPAEAKNDAGLFNEHFRASSEETERSYDMISPFASESDIYNWLRSYEIDKSDDRHVFVIEAFSDSSPGSVSPGSHANSANPASPVTHGNSLCPLARFLGYVDVWEATGRFGVFKTGIKMTENAAGNGFAASAFGRILDYYFNELRYEKCGVYIYEFNRASLRFHEKMGFTEEGRLRRECFTRGKYYDALYYGLLRDEFNIKKNG